MQVAVSEQDASAIGMPYDYADAFTVALSTSDHRSAEVFARDALESAPPPLRWLVWSVFRWVLRFELGPRSSPQHVLGWSIVSSSQDEVRLQTHSRLFRAVLLGTRPDPQTAKIVTALVYDDPKSSVIWSVVAPVHRQVARILLQSARRPRV